MRKLAWILLALVLTFGGYRVYDRNTQPVAPPEIVQTVEQPAPPVVQAPVPAPKAKPAPRPAPQGKRTPRPVPKAKPRPKTPPVAPAAPDSKFPRGAANGALPVSCATVRWYAAHAPGLGQRMAAAYNPTAEQIAAAKACLKK